LRNDVYNQHINVHPYWNHCLHICTGDHFHLAFEIAPEGAAAGCGKGIGYEIPCKTWRAVKQVHL
jgi:hypothetical protein